MQFINVHKLLAVRREEKKRREKWTLRIIRNGPYPWIDTHPRIGKLPRLPDTVTLRSRHDRVLVYRRRYSNYTGGHTSSQVLNLWVSSSHHMQCLAYLPTLLYQSSGTQFPSHGMGWPGRRYNHLPSDSQHRVGIEPRPPARKPRSITTTLLRLYLLLAVSSCFQTFNFGDFDEEKTYSLEHKSNLIFHWQKCSHTCFFHNGSLHFFTLIVNLKNISNLIG